MCNVARNTYGEQICFTISGTLTRDHQVKSVGVDSLGEVTLTLSIECGCGEEILRIKAKDLMYISNLVERLMNDKKER